MAQLESIGGKLYIGGVEVVLADAKSLLTAWVNFDGTSAVGVDCTIRSGYNISRVEHSATGKYILHFTEEMDNPEYNVISQVDGLSTRVIPSTVNLTKTIATVEINLVYDASIFVDEGLAVNITGGKA